MASSETEPPPAGPSGKARKRAAVFIGAFVLAQFLIPLSYLAREDAADQRFTWRRLTGAEAAKCETRASLERPDGRREPISLEKLIHPDWVRYVEQNRRDVVDAFLLKQCEARDVLEVELVNHCGDERETRTYRLRCGGGRSQQTVRTAAR